MSSHPLRHRGILRSLCKHAAPLGVAPALLAFLSLQFLPFQYLFAESLPNAEAMVRRDMLMEDFGEATFRFGGTNDGVQSGVEVFIPLYQTDDGAFFFYPEGTLGDGWASSFSLGFGYRHLLENPGVIVGGNVFFDHTETGNGSQINQAGLGIEFLSKWVDARANVYLPSTHTNLYDTQQTRLVSSRTASRLLNQRVIGNGQNGQLGFSGNNLIFGGRFETVSTFQDTTTRTIRNLTLERREAGMTGMDAEAGVLLPWIDRFADVRLFGGYFFYDNPYGSDIDGFKGRVEVRIVPAITLDAEYYSDARLIGSHWYSGIRFNVPFELANLSRGVSPFDGFTESFHRPPPETKNIALRMDENIMRQSSARTSDSGFVAAGRSSARTTQSSQRRVEREVQDTMVVVTDGGDPITIDHVNSRGARGRGTFEDPYGRLSSLNNTKADILYIHADSVFRNETLTIGGTAQILGEGGGLKHIIETDQFGRIELPRATNGKRLPQFLGGGPTGAIVLRSNAEDIQISGFTLDGGVRGIAGLGGATDTRISNMNIRNMTAAGIEITPSTRTTIENVSFSGNATDTILNAESTVYRNIESINSGIGLDLRNTSGQTLVENYRFTGGGTSTYGLLLTNPGGTIDLNKVHIDGAGTTDTGIGVLGGDATISLKDSSVGDTVQSGIRVSGGSANLNLDSVSLNINSGSPLAVEGGHTGVVQVQSNVEMRITGGSGFVFADADGEYNFENSIELTGTTQGLKVQPTSAGRFTFGDFSVNGATLTGAAIDLAGVNSNPISFGDVTITNLGAFTGVNLAGSNSAVNMDSLSITGTGVAGSTAVDYRGASNSLTVANGGSVRNVVTGFDLGALTTGDLSYRDGTIEAGIPINAVGLGQGSGTFDFTGTTFVKDNALSTATGFGNNFYFVDSNGSGSGRSNDPTSIDNAESVSLAGDIIALVNDGATITSTNGVTLKNNQQLIGFANGNTTVDFTAQAAALNILGTLDYQIEDPTGNGSATLTNSNATPALIDLANGNSVRGFSLAGSSADAAVRGNGISSGVISNLTFVPGGTNDAFHFSNTTGVISVNSSTVTNIAGNAVVVDGGSGTINFGADIDIDDAGAAVLVRNRAGGSVNFLGTVQATGTSSGIEISGATAANQVNFTSAVNLGTSGNRLTGSTALNIDGNAIGGNQVNFANTLNIHTNSRDGVIAANGGSLLINTGVVDVQGNGADGVILTDVNAGIALATLNAGNQVGTNADGINLANVTGEFRITGSASLGGNATTINRGVVVTGGSVDLTFASLSVQGRTGTGISLDGTSGEHFFIQTNIANQNSSNASAISVQNLTGGAVSFVGQSFAINQGTGSGPALFLNDNDASFYFSGGSVQSSGGSVVEITGQQEAVTFQAASLTQSGTGKLLDIHDVTGGNNILFSAGGDLSAFGSNGGTRIALTNNIANITIANATITSGGTNDAVTVSGGTGQVNFSTLNINAAGQDGIDVSNLTGVVQLQTGSNIANVAGHGLLVNGNGGATAVQVFGGATFNTVGGDAIHITDTTGNVTISDTYGDGIAGEMFEVDTTGEVQITRGLTLADVAGGLFINQTGTHSLQGSILSNLSIQGGDATINVGGTTTVLGNNTGPVISITNGAAGSLNFASAAFINQGSQSNTGLLIDNASTAVTINGTSNLGGIMIRNGATSTVTFNGAVTVDSGASDAITMSSAGTMDFNGSLIVLTTSGLGMNISAGTLNTARGMINTGDGQAMNIANATANVALDNVASTSSSSEGIRLNNVAGSFSIASVQISEAAGDSILLSNNSAAIALGDAGIFAGGADGIKIVDNAQTVTISGGFLDLPSGDGIDVTNTSVVISNVFMGPGVPIGGAGIRIATTGTARTAILNNNTIGSSGDSIVTTDTGVAGELSLTMNGNNLRTRTAGSKGMRITGSGAGSTNINSLDGVTVNGGVGSGGLLFENVTFDAVTGGAIQEVAAGTAQIGLSTGNRVAGDGIYLNNTSGSLSFTSLNIFNSAGSGLRSNSAMTLANGGGSINTTTGAAVSLTNTQLGAMNFASLTSTNGGNGVLLNATSGGTFTVTGPVTVTNASGAAVEINNSSSNVTLGSVAITSARGISQTDSSGSLTVNGGTITSNNLGGMGVSIDGGTGAVLFNNVDINQNFLGAIVSVTDRAAGSSTLFNADGSIKSMGSGYVLIDNNAAEVTLNNIDTLFSDTAVTISNNSAAINISGFKITEAIAGVRITNNTELVTLANGSVDGAGVVGGMVISDSDARIDNVTFGEVQGLNGDAVSILNTDATSNSVAFVNSNIESGTRGIVATNSGSGDLSLSVSDSSMQATGNSVEVRTAGLGNLLLNLTDSTLGSGLFADGSTGPGILYVTGLSGTTVSSAPNQGMTFNHVTFDATPGGAIDPVQAGNAAIASSGDGLRFHDVIGAIDYGTLTINNGAGTGLYVTEGSAGFTFAADTLDVTSTAGAALELTGNFAISGGTISSAHAPGPAVLFDGATGTITLDSVTANESQTGLALANNAATITLGSLTVNGGLGSSSGIYASTNTSTLTVTGLTTINDVGTGIQLSGADGGLVLGDVQIDGATDGVNLTNASGSYQFGNIDMVNVSGVGLNFVASNLVFTAASFDMNGGTTAIDLSATDNPLGPNSANSNIVITNGGIIQNVARGVDLSLNDNTATSAGANFVFGGGSIQATVATVDAIGLITNSPYDQGRYDFTGVTFNGPVLFPQLVSGRLYYVSADGGGDGSAPNNTMTIGEADLISDADAVFVLVNDALNTPIQLSSTFSLASGQQFNGFGNNNAVGESQPVNVIGNFGVNPITSPYGAATLRANGAFDLVTVAGDNQIRNINLSSGTNSVAGSGFSNLLVTGTNIIGGSESVFKFTNPTGSINLSAGSGVTISQSGGRLLDLDGGNAFVSLNAGLGSIVNENGYGIRVRNTTNSLVSLNGLTINNAAGTPLVFDHNAAGITFTNSHVQTSAGVTLLEIDATGASLSTYDFDATNTFDHSTGTIAKIGGGNRDIDLSAHNFSSTGSAFRAVEINGQGNGTISFGDITWSNSTAANAIKITHNNSGTISFGTVTVDGYGDEPGDIAVDIQADSPGPITFADLDITTINGAGFRAVGPAILNPGSSATIDATGGTALHLDGIRGLGGSFASVTSTYAGAGNYGINIERLEGDFGVASATVNNSGLSGIRISDTGAVFTLGSATVRNLNTDAIIVSNIPNSVFGSVNINNVNIDDITGNGIVVTSSSKVTIDGGTIDDVSGHGIRSVNSSITVSDTNIGGDIAVGGSGISLKVTAGNDRSISILENNVRSNGIALDASTVDTGSRFYLTADGNTLQSLSTWASNVAGDRVNNLMQVNSFNGNTVVGGATSGGVQFSGARFVSTAFGETHIGSAPNRVNGTGLQITDSTGSLGSVSLNIHNQGASGFSLESENFNDLTFTTSGGTVDTLSGPAITVKEITIGGLLDNAISVNSPTYGISYSEVVNGGYTIANVSISNAAGIGMDISRAIGLHTFGTVTIDGASTGIVAGPQFGGSAFNFTGQTTIRNVSAAGIRPLAGGGVNFNDVLIENAETGIDFRNVTIGFYSFGDIDLVNIADGGLNMINSRVELMADSLDVDGAKTAIDLGNAKSAQDPFSPNINIVNGGTIRNVERGVALYNAGLTFVEAGVNFRFGGGSISASKYTVDAGGLISGHPFTDKGHFDFTTTTFDGNFGFGFAQGNLMFVGGTATGLGDGSTLDNLASIATADANTDGSKVFVMVNNAGAIDVGTGFTLGGGQRIDGFGNGNGFSQVQPINVVGDNIASGLSITDSRGAATLTGTGTIVELGGNNAINNIAFSGGATSIVANGVNDFQLSNITSMTGGSTTMFSFTNIGGTFSITNNSIAQTGGRLLDLDGGNATLSLTAGTGSITNTDGSGIRIQNTTGGSITLAGLQISGADSTPLVFDNNDAAISFTGNSVSADAQTTLLDVDANSESSTNLVFDNTNTFAHTSGTIATIGGGSRDIDLSAHNFTNIGTTANRVISSTNQTGGTISFGNVDIIGFDHLGGVAVNLQGSDATVSFNDLDITTVNGTALSVGGITFELGNTSSIQAVNGSGLVMRGTTVEPGTTFSSIESSNPEVDTYGIRIRDIVGTLNIQSATVSGATGPVGSGIRLEGGSVVFGTVDLENNTNGINLYGATGTYLFGDVDITGAGAGRAIDLRNSNVQLEIDNLGITGIDAAGSIAIDLSGSLNPHGANSTIPNILLANSAGETAVINGVYTGVLHGSVDEGSAGAYFVYGNQLPANGSQINVTSPGALTLDTTYLTSTDPHTQGRYEYAGVSFTGQSSFATGNAFYVGATATGDGSGSNANNLATYTDAEGLPVSRVIVLVARPGATTLSLGAGDSWDLADGHQLFGFGSGTISIPTQPINVIGSFFTDITDPFGQGEITVQGQAGLNVFNLADGNSLSGFHVVGGLNSFSGTGINGLSMTGMTASGALGNVFQFSNASGAINIDANIGTMIGTTFATITGGAADYTFSRSGDGSFEASNGGLSITGTTGGSVALNGGASWVGSAGTIVTLDNNAATISLAGLDLAGTGADLFNIDAVTASTGAIVLTGSGTLTGGRGFTIGAGSRIVDAGGFDFASSGSTADSVISVAGLSGETISFGTIEISGYTNATGTAINLVGTGGQVTFGGLDVTATDGDAFTANGIGLTISGSPTLAASSGRALSLTDVTLGSALNFDEVDSAGSDAEGIFLMNTGGAAITFGADSDIATAAGAAFVVNGGGDQIVFHGNITGTENARLIAILNRAGGEVAFETGTLTHTEGDGILLRANSGNVRFSQNLTIANSGRDGIEVTGAGAGGYTFAGLTINNSAGRGIDLTGWNGLGGGSLVTGNLSINGTGSSDSGLYAPSNTTGVAMTVNGTLNVANTGPIAVHFNGSSMNMTVTGAGVISSLGGNSALIFDNNASGAYLLGGVAAVAEAGIAFSDAAAISKLGAANNNPNRIRIGDMLTTWFVRQGATGIGTLADPASAAFVLSNSQANSAIYLLDGGGTIDTGAASFALKDNQLLFSSTGGTINVNGRLANTANLFTFTSPNTAAATLQSNSGVTAVTLAVNNELSNFTIGNAGTAIAGSNFGTVAVNGMAINTNGGALNLNNGTVAGSGFTSITSTGGTNAVSLVGIETIFGTFNLGGGSLSGASGATFLVNGGNIQTTYSGNMSQASNAPLVSIAGHNALFRRITFTGTLVATNGSGLQFDNAGGGYSFDGTTTLNGGDAGIDIVNSTGSFFFAGGTSITNPTGGAFRIDGGASTLGVNHINYRGTITNNSGPMISMTNRSQGYADFSNINSGSFVDTGAGVLVNGGSSDLYLSDAILNGSRGVEIIGANSGDLRLTNSTIDTANGAGNHAIVIDGDGGNPANDGITGAIEFRNVDVTNPGGYIASIQGVRSGTVSFDGLSSFVRNDGGAGIFVGSNSGGTITFGGSSKVLNTGTNTAVTLTDNTGANINFTNGGLDIDTTTGGGMNVTGGGGLSVQGAGNSISTGTGIALNIVDTTIAAAGTTFASISANGASSGIILRNTGGGLLHVTGTGTAGSGGTIQNTTSHAISLNSARLTSLDYMNILNTGGNGIHGDSIESLAVNHFQFTNIGNGDDENAITVVNPRNGIDVRNSSFYNVAEDFIRVDGGVDWQFGVTIANSTFTQPDTLAAIRANGLYAGRGISVTSQGTQRALVHINGSVFTDIVGEAVLLESGSSASDNVFEIRLNDFLVTVPSALGNPNNRGNAVSIRGTGSTQLKVNVGNEFSGGSGGIQLSADGGANITADIIGNTISNSFAGGISVRLEDNASVTANIDHNDIINTSGAALVFANNGTGGISTLNATITDNEINGYNSNAGGNAFMGGIVVLGGADASDITFINIQDNSVSGNPNPGTFFDYVLDGSFGGSILVEGAGTAAVTEADLLAPGVLGNTSGSIPAGRTSINNAFFSNGATVPLP